MYLNDLLVPSITIVQHQNAAPFAPLEPADVWRHSKFRQMGAQSSRNLFLGPIKLSSSKVAAIIVFLRSTSLGAVREFLALINFYQRFIPRCAEILEPRVNVLRSGSSNFDASFMWSTETTFASSTAEKGLADATLLVHPRNYVPSTAVGRVLEQFLIEEWKPIAPRPNKSLYTTVGTKVLSMFLTATYF